MPTKKCDCPCCTKRRAKAAARRKEHLVAGRCYKCGKPVAETSVRFCLEHVEARRRQDKARQVAHALAGTCVKCDRPAIEGRSRCKVHQEASRVWQRAYLAKKKEQAA